MRITRVVAKVLAIVVIILISAIVSIALLLYWHNSPTDVYNVSIAAVSAVLSIVALAYAMITYYSIDKVQAVNSMEGNVLSDEKYSIAYTDIISEYEDCKNEAEFSNKIKSAVKYENCKSCLKLAEELQNIVDNLIWFAYIKDNDSKNRIRNVVRRLEEISQSSFGDINNGLKVLFEEYFKLINNVLDYQSKRQHERRIEISTINSIRGEMIGNPIARIVYYDYLGLEYRSRAEGLLELTGSMYKAENLIAIKEKLTDEAIRFKCNALLKHAEKAMARANEIADDNLLWNCYIKYNLARIHVFIHLIDENNISLEFVKKEVKEAADIRKELLFIIWGVSINDNVSDRAFLCKKMKEEFDAAAELQKVVESWSLK